MLPRFVAGSLMRSREDPDAAPRLRGDLEVSRQHLVDTCAELLAANGGAAVARFGREV